MGWLSTALCALVLPLVGCGGTGVAPDAGLRDAAGADAWSGDADTPDASRADAGMAEPATCQPLSLSARDGDGPARLLDNPALHPTAEAPAIIPTGPGGHHNTAVVNIPGGSAVLLIDFQLRVFPEVWGVPWVLPVTIVAPMAGELRHPDSVFLSTGYGARASVTAGGLDPTWGDRHPDYFHGTNHADRASFTTGGRVDLAAWARADAFLRTYADSFVVERGMPLVVTDVVPRGIRLDSTDMGPVLRRALAANDLACDDDFCSGVLDAHRLTQCLSRAALLMEDLSLEAYIRYAIGASRVLDAAQEVLRQVWATTPAAPVVRFDHVFAVGCSKRGNTLRTLAAIDPRTDAVMVACADVANFPAFVDQQQALWTEGYSFAGTAELADSLGPIGETWMRAFDMARWRPEVLADTTMIIAEGTRDPLYQLPALYTYADSLPPSHRFVFVPNFLHGFGSIDHLSALRSMVDHGLEGTEMPAVRASWDEAGDEVVATIRHAEVDTAQLWCATNYDLDAVGAPDRCGVSSMLPPGADDHDYRHATFEPVDMVASTDGRLHATPPSSRYTDGVCLVRVLTTAGEVVTSLPLLSASLCHAAGLQLR